jgi:DNA-directed RNA polymerase specialized sigma24 family protein
MEGTSTLGGDQKMAGQTGSQGAAVTDWGKLSKGLFVYCRRRHGLPVEDANEIAQEALCRAVDPRRPRDPERYPDIKFWLQSIVNGLVSNRRRNAARKMEKLVENMPEAPSTDIAGVAVAPPRPDERVLTADSARRAVTKVLERVKGNTLAEAVVLMMADGLDKVGDQASEQKVEVKRIYRAREKVAEVTAEVKREMEDE